MPHLFTYGTLMFPGVWQIVVGSDGSGREFETTPATLPGYQIYRVRDAVYPGIIEVENSSPFLLPLTSDLRPLPPLSVPGLLYFDVEAASLSRLDRFEGDDYCRISVEVTISNGQTIVADTYVIPSEHRHLLTDEPWTPQKFAADGHLEKFIAKYSGFTRLD